MQQVNSRYNLFATIPLLLLDMRSSPARGIWNSWRLRPISSIGARKKCGGLTRRVTDRACFSRKSGPELQKPRKVFTEKPSPQVARAHGDCGEQRSAADSWPNLLSPMLGIQVPNGFKVLVASSRWRRPNKTMTQDPRRLDGHINTVCDDRMCFAGGIAHEKDPLAPAAPNSWAKRSGGVPLPVEEACAQTWLTAALDC